MNSLVVIAIAICVMMGCLAPQYPSTIYSNTIALPVIPECPYIMYPDAYETSSFNPLHQ